MFLRRLYRKRYFKWLVFVFTVFIFWAVIGYLVSYEDEDFPDDVIYDIFIDETQDDHEHIPLDQEMLEEMQRVKTSKKYETVDATNVTDPIILWWTEFTGEPGKSRSCGNDRCFFTNNRNFRNHKHMKVFVFYGTDFSQKDLPLPRRQHHEWALFHEESPKNNFLLCHEDALSLTACCILRRESDFPITTQHLLSLEWLQQSTYTKSTSQKNRQVVHAEGLAPVVYVQSDCNPPSDRDEFVKQLMKFIPVDSYGTCLNNKQLPQKLMSPLEGMAHKDFYELLSHYKFVLAMENAVCDDYITEKLWRPLMVGAVPVVFGSPKVKDFLPSNTSALVITDFNSAEHLAKHLQYLNNKDMEYDKLQRWKDTGVSNQLLHNILSTRVWSPDDDKTWTPDHVNFVEAFECFICKRVHENLKRVSRGEETVQWKANVDHYGCPKPMKFDESGKYGKEPPLNDYWSAHWLQQKHAAKALKECISSEIPYCGDYRKSKDLRRDF
ncbi:unnamed protein product [Candidula unifasciata]|uniref:Fucosyltransferase n=1 Tax=Candidula unifasciata TaxID=100452 RepID=A0A8S4AC70_9EUPU|nr:unnamed protein product [Candidula unifasciata]